MQSLLARIRALPPLTLALAAVPVVAVLFLLFAAVLAPDEIVGLLALTAYVIFVIGLAMAVTFLVVKLSPSQSAKEQAQQSSS